MCVCVCEREREREECVYVLRERGERRVCVCVERERQRELVSTQKIQLLCDHPRGVLLVLCHTYQAFNACPKSVSVPSVYTLAQWRECSGCG